MTTSTDNQAPPANSVPWQFSLGGLMSFTVACAVYCSTIRACAMMMERQVPLTPKEMAVIGCPIWICWLAFFGLYKFWKLRPAIVVHLSGPVMVIAVACLFAIPQVLISPNPWPVASELLLSGLIIITFGTLISILFGFPVVALMLLVRRRVRK